MSIVYVLVFFLTCFLFSYVERNQNISFLKWVFIVPFCVLVASRSIDVPDTDVYMTYFFNEDSSLIYYVDYGFEIGFQVLTKLLKNITEENFRIYFALITLLNLIVIDYAAKRIFSVFQKEQTEPTINSNLYEYQNDATQGRHLSIIALTLYVAFFGLYVNAVVLRAGLAFSLMVLATSFAIDIRKKSDYIIIASLLLLAYFFHNTALLGVFIVLVLMFSKKFTLNTYLVFSVIIGVIYFVNLTPRLGSTVFDLILSLNNLTVVAYKLSEYGGASLFVSEGISMKFTFFWMISFILPMNDTSSKSYYKFLNVYFIGLAVFAFMRSVLLVERVTDYFLLFSFVLFYLYLIRQNNFKFWAYYIGMVLVQIVFVMRIINREML
ncbi:MAG: EpsG family protein [Pigmentiphaga sp.]|nr:EpsG family protein [Pigmentiphaga sp.]